MNRDHVHALPAGYLLNEYRIEKVLGHGGFGITYLAHDENLAAKVAIKEYLPDEFAVRDARSTVSDTSPVESRPSRRAAIRSRAMSKPVTCSKISARARATVGPREALPE